MASFSVHAVVRGSTSLPAHRERVSEVTASMEGTGQKSRTQREIFEVEEKDGTQVLQDMLLDTMADYLNTKHGREVVIRRGRGSEG